MEGELEYSGDLCLFEIQDGQQTLSEWLILMQSQGNGQWKWGIKGAYYSKHRVRKNNMGLITYGENNGHDLMKTDCGYWPHMAGGCWMPKSLGTSQIAEQDGCPRWLIGNLNGYGRYSPGVTGSFKWSMPAKFHGYGLHFSLKYSPKILVWWLWGCYWWLEDRNSQAMIRACLW